LAALPILWWSVADVRKGPLGRFQGSARLDLARHYFFLLALGVLLIITTRWRTWETNAARIPSLGGIRATRLMLVFASQGPISEEAVTPESLNWDPKFALVGH
jgi:hypothetical protein